LVDESGKEFEVKKGDFVLILPDENINIKTVPSKIPSS